MASSTVDAAGTGYPVHQYHNSGSTTLTSVNPNPDTIVRPIEISHKVAHGRIFAREELDRDYH